jgi:hypothetical protein
VTLPEFELQTIIGNNFLKLNGDDASAMSKRVAACDNSDIRPVRVTGIRRAWNAPGVRAKALQVRQLPASLQDSVILFFGMYSNGQ